MNKNTIKMGQLKTLIKEVITQMNELVGDEPKIGQFKWDYEIQIHVKTSYTEYDRTDVSHTTPILADTEEEAKKQAIAAYNPKVVTIKSVKVFKRGSVTQADLDQHDRATASIAHQLRPKDQGGWGADEGVLKEASEDDIKRFALDIVEKIKDRQRKKGFQDMNIGEAIRQMVEHKLRKEGWTKGGLELTDKPDASGAVLNITPAIKEDAGAHFDPQHKFLVVNYQSGFSRYFSTEQEAVNEAELIGGEVYEIRRQIQYKYLGYPTGLRKQAKTNPKLAGQIAIGRGNKLFNVSLDRPGAGWTETVRANSSEEAKKKANKLHPNEPADTVWEYK